jgi:NADPH:quinone reductase-like Zn-dependent oxidoreductase
MKHLPLIMLGDGFGVVESVGEGVTRVKEGDRVCPLFFQSWMSGEPNQKRLSLSLGCELDGTMAEFMVLPEEGVALVPPHLDDMEAASLPAAAVTAWRALVTEGRTKPGYKVLVQGTGGVSLFALQFAKMLGAHVIATSSTDEKLAQVRALGADETINYNSVPEWGKRAREIAGGDGVDHVVEVGGQVTLPQSLRAIRPGGHNKHDRCAFRWSYERALGANCNPTCPAAGNYRGER